MSNVVNRGIESNSRNSQRTPTFQPPAKRQRTSRACDQCRGRKYRCDSRQPSCSPCANNGLACSYESSTKKRGLPTGYVRVLETLFGLVFAVIPDSEIAVGHLLGQIELFLDDEGKVITSSSLAESPEALRHRWMRSQVRLDVDGLVANLTSDPITLTTLKEKVSQNDSILSSHSQTESLGGQFNLRSWTGGILESNLEQQDGKSSSKPLELINSQLQSSDDSQNMRTGTETVRKLPSEAVELLNLYFTCTHCWFPVVTKHKVFQALYSPDKEDRQMTRFTTTLWAILAVSHQQATLLELPFASHIDFTPLQLYSLAHGMALSDTSTPDIGHAQALLMLSLFDISHGRWISAWLLVGRALRIAELLQNSDRCISIGLPTSSTSSGAHRRLLKGCFVLETIISSRISQKPHIRTHDLGDFRTCQDDDSDEWDPWNDPSNLFKGTDSTIYMPRGPLRASSIFNQLVQLLGFLNDTSSLQLFSDNSSLIAEQLTSLKLWFENLPLHCKLPQPMQTDRLVNSQASPQQFNLHLMYYTIHSIIIQKSPQYLQELQGQSTPEECLLLLKNSYSQRFTGWPAPATFQFCNYVQAIPSLPATSSKIVSGVASNEALAGRKKGVTEGFLRPRGGPERNDFDPQQIRPQRWDDNNEFIASTFVTQTRSPLSRGTTTDARGQDTHENDPSIQHTPYSKSGDASAAENLRFEGNVESNSTIPQLLDLARIPTQNTSMISSNDGGSIDPDVPQSSSAVPFAVDWSPVSYEFMRNLGFTTPDAQMPFSSSVFDFDTFIFGDSR